MYKSQTRRCCPIVLFTLLPIDRSRSTAAQASNAISQLSETELMGRPILIREDRGDGGKHGRGVGGVAGARVFVGNLSWQVTWQALKDHMRSVRV